MSRLGGAMRRAAALPRADVLTVVAASAMFPVVSAMVHTVGVARTASLIHTLPLGQKRGGDRVAAATHLCRLVTAAASRSPWSPQCLVRSLVLLYLMRRQGLVGSLRLGVRTAGGFGAHAWVDLEGVVIGDEEHAREYVEVNDWRRHGA